MYTTLTQGETIKMKYSRRKRNHGLPSPIANLLSFLLLTKSNPPSVAHWPSSPFNAQTKNKNLKQNSFSPRFLLLLLLILLPISPMKIPTLGAPNIWAFIADLGLCLGASFHHDGSSGRLSTGPLLAFLTCLVYPSLGRLPRSHEQVGCLEGLTIAGSAIRRYRSAGEGF